MSEQSDLPLEEQNDEPVTVDPQVLADLQTRASALETKLQAAEIDRARLEEQVKAAVAPPPAPSTPPPPTHEQLQEAVDNGQLTQAQMNQEVARQMRAELHSSISNDLRAEYAAAEQLKTVISQYDQYMALKPDVAVDGTEDRKRLQAAFKELVDLGYPSGEKRTELVAMKNVFGPLERIEETTRLRRDTHRETGGGGGGHEGPSSGADWEKGLTAGQRDAFRHQLGTGLYPSETDKKFLAVVTRARTGNAEKKAS